MVNQHQLLERVKPVHLGWATILRASSWCRSDGGLCVLWRPELSGVGTIDDLPTVIYYSLSLFVLGGVDLGVPIAD